jgi:hypothetical protein
MKSEEPRSSKILPTSAILFIGLSILSRTYNTGNIKRSVVGEAGSIPISPRPQIDISEHSFEVIRLHIT